MKTTKRKDYTIRLDNIFSAQEIREISDAILGGIKKTSSKKRKRISQALKR